MTDLQLQMNFAPNLWLRLKSIFFSIKSLLLQIESYKDKSLFTTSLYCSGKIKDNRKDINHYCGFTMHSKKKPKTNKKPEESKQYLCSKSYSK